MFVDVSTIGVATVVVVGNAVDITAYAIRFDVVVYGVVDDVVSVVAAVVIVDDGLPYDGVRIPIVVFVLTVSRTVAVVAVCVDVSGVYGAVV